jgi:transcriptional regulator GlxA family with amidase domain
VRDVKFVDEGDVLTSGGISAGINMSFHLIKRIFDADVAKITAKRMEYDIDL